MDRLAPHGLAGATLRIPAQMTSLSRMLVVANTDWFLANFMAPFLASHVRAGIEIVAASPAGKYVDKLERAGIRWAEIPMSRGRGSIGSNLATMASIRRLERETRPDLVHLVTAKSVIFGNLALSGRDGPGVINVLPGLGHAFSASGVPAWIDRHALLWGIRWAASRRRALTVFHQAADRERILGRGGATRRRCRIIPGWGVDLARFSRASRAQEPPLVVMVSRMLWSKGVGDYVQAAQICREATDARFVLVGDSDPGNPFPIPTGQLEDWHKTGWIEWWRHRDDIPEVLAQASVFVLPTRYGEGVPQALIEAAAIGIPIVASDLPGCREVVEQGVNGWLVPPGDSGRLAEAILGLLRDPELRRRMGAEGKELARQRFAGERIEAQYGDVYRELGLDWRAAGGGR